MEKHFCKDFFVNLEDQLIFQKAAFRAQRLNTEGSRRVIKNRRTILHEKRFRHFFQKEAQKSLKSKKIPLVHFFSKFEKNYFSFQSIKPAKFYRIDFLQISFLK